MLKNINFNYLALGLLVVCVAFGIMPDPASAAVAMAFGGNTLLADLQQRRGKAIHAARALHEKVESENRAMTADEQAQYDKYMDEQADLQARIERTEKQDKLDKEMAAIVAQTTDTVAQSGGNVDKAMELHMQAFVTAIKSGVAAVASDPALRAALDTTTTESGGALVAPQQFVEQLIKAVDDQTFIRGLANVIQIVGTDSLGAPSLDSDPADADWTSELATGNEDSAMSFGGRELNPQPLAKRIKVSRTLLRRSAVPVEQIVMQRLAYKFGITEEKAFLTGNGANQPLGVFTASAKGISTARDVTAAGATAIVGDDLINVKYSLKAQYQQTAEWIIHRDVVKVIAKLKDTTNQYIWRTGLTTGEPDRLLDRPVHMSEYAPGTVATGLYTAILGDFSNYWIAEEASFSLQRLEELYAEANQVGFIARTHIDGMPVLEEAFARLKQA